ncbi:CLC_0170 family protein [Bacillus sp. J37]|uniref:CLC_0170 family protein n=1 Tax=Bacillus sp. J37 TaxID=935837 RepID=UPI000479BBB8|nr:CLC_0170 family protein [Bacillus sp. J37]
MYIGYMNYLIAIFIITGCLIMRYDYPFYKNKKMKKEEKVTKFFGRGNIVLGLLLFAGNWVYNTWFK